ncbi:MAG: DUF4065 domain-containing protein [Bacteroidales bacterium]|nr:DUF4065 domain-containing protein [Bacteroidales bacterium]
MAYLVEQIANQLLINAADSGELMTNMKLQKMLYYQQGFHLAYFDTPLFNDDIEAWMYGPVVPSMYEKYKEFGRNGIEPDRSIDFSFDERKEQALFEEVCKVYGAFSAIGLMNMTHDEMPWKTTPVGEGTGHVISKDKMRLFFKERLKD